MRSPQTVGRRPGIMAAFSRARVQERFDEMVLISPLWASARNGWAMCHEGNVLVEYR